jgi:hypothetical protein
MACTGADRPHFFDVLHDFHSAVAAAAVLLQRRFECARKVECAGVQHSMSCGVCLLNSYDVCRIHCDCGPKRLHLPCVLTALQYAAYFLGQRFFKATYAMINFSACWCATAGHQTTCVACTALLVDCTALLACSCYALRFWLSLPRSAMHAYA